jgi:hypothetical protein
MTEQREREEQLGKLFTASVSKLLERVESGKASASDYKNIIQFLKDNGINCAVKKGTPIGRLAEVLPFTAEDAQ